MSEPIAFKWFQGAQARSVAAYDDGSTCTLTNSDSHQPAIAMMTNRADASEQDRGLSDSRPKTYMLKLRHTGSENIGGVRALCGERT